MAFHIRDDETNTLVRELARLKGIGLTEAVKLAVRRELDAVARKVPLHEQLQKVVDTIASYPDTGAKLDKKFFDELSGN